MQQQYHFQFKIKWENPVDHFSSEEKEEKIEQLNLIWEPKKDSVNLWTPSLHETSSLHWGNN